MKIFFRTDASTDIGTGHVVRCATLAEELKTRGADVAFICREHKGNLIAWLEENRKLRVYVLPGMNDRSDTANERELRHASWLGASWNDDARQTVSIVAQNPGVCDWMIVDHYALDHKWESFSRSVTNKIAVIDDLADRLHDCDVLLDPNLHMNPLKRYEKLVPPACKLLLGPRFAIIRPEFKQIRERNRCRDGTIKRILVFMGGSDPANATELAVEGLKIAKISTMHVDVVVGATNPKKKHIEKLCREEPNMTFHCQVNNMADLMERADLSIGAGGTTMWERCLLGLPAIVVSTADNQISMAETVAHKGAICYLGRKESSSAENIAKALRWVLHSPEHAQTLSRRSMELMKEFEFQGDSLFLQTLFEHAYH